MSEILHYHTVNLAMGELLKTFPHATKDEVSAALDKAHEAYTKFWRHTPVAERAKLIGKVAALLRERMQELAEIGVREIGKTLPITMFELTTAADILDYYAKNGEAFLKTVPLPGVPGTEVASEPLGVLLAIEPWNFPFYQAARVAGPHLIAGNTLLLKPAETVPQSALAFEKLFIDAGAPEGVFKTLFCSIPQAHEIIADFRVRGVTLTGSEVAGAAVAEAAGRNLKKVVLELGGSDPFIVLEDAPLEEAIQTAVISRLINVGQACASTKRYIVVGKERAQQFQEGVVKIFSAIQPGDPMDPNTTFGPLFSERGAQRLLGQIEAAKAAGATVVYGGKRIDRPGFYVEPTLITNISRENPLFMQEAFGPVASLYIVDTEEEAIELANATHFGLGAVVFSTNIAHAKEVASKIDAGMVFINSMINAGPEVPFGGVKNSGFGREGSELGIHEFVNKKVIRVHEKYL
ncbi:Succinate-semialdehyde dehydrogenase [Cladobotryum mycophilum]|uniref:Succinate-semialdehyde dehydrogenase n=1 Tax=Cladobotryum mycophilum TaxID=491253 RepID=A0ABR0SXU0_9HYPO